MFDIFQSNEELFSNKTKRNKCYSEPKEKYKRLNLRKKFRNFRKNGSKSFN